MVLFCSNQKNEPCNILIVANYLADLYDVSFEEVSNVTTKNVFSLFDLDGRL
jgi:Tat protein secretion system quality control protein TatD with DNase activity